MAVIASSRLANRHYSMFGGGDLLAGCAYRREGHRELQVETQKRGKLSHRDPHKRSSQMARWSVRTIPLYLLITWLAWLHTFSSLHMPTLLKRWICLMWNNTSPFSTPSNLCQQRSTMGPLFMDWQFKAWKQEMKWEEERKENCLYCPSPSLCIAYLSVVIGSFNVSGEFR